MIHMYSFTIIITITLQNPIVLLPLITHQPVTPVLAMQGETAEALCLKVLPAWSGTQAR